MKELTSALLSCDKSRNRLLQPTEDDQEDKASARLAAANVINKETLQSWRFCHLTFKKEQIGHLRFFSVEKSFHFTLMYISKIFFSCKYIETCICVPHNCSHLGQRDSDGPRPAAHIQHCAVLVQLRPLPHGRVENLCSSCVHLQGEHRHPSGLNSRSKNKNACDSETPSE